MNSKFFHFCALCFRTNKSGKSRYYCEQHQPKTNLYNSDRLKIKRISVDRFHKVLGHKEKTQLLSDELDKLAPSPSYLLSNTRKTRHNGKLSFEPAFKLIERNYKKAFYKLDKESFSTSFPRRWVAGYITRLGYRIRELQEIINSVSDSELFELIVIISARYQAYYCMIEHFKDGRERDKKIKLSGSKKTKYLSLINSLPRKPNGKVCRTTLGKASGDGRHKAGRIIKRLKENGDVDGDI